MTKPKAKPIPADQIRAQVRKAVIAQAKAKVRRKQVATLRKLGNGNGRRK